MGPTGRRRAPIFVWLSTAALVAGCGGTPVAPEAPGGAAGTSGAVADVDARLPFPGDQVLARIAQLLWQGPPDDALAAKGSGLEWTSDLVPLVRAMLADPRAAAGVGAFFDWWLELTELPSHDVDATLFPTVTPDLLRDMASEARAFGVSLTLSGGTYGTLLTSRASFVDGRLAELYGVSGVAGDDLRPTTLPPERPGILTRAAVLALPSPPDRTSAVARGASILRTFFCSAVPPPPPAQDTPFPMMPPGTTQRSALELTLQQGGPVCEACHASMDPLGLAFEGFDAVGRARTLDNGGAIDTSNLPVIGAKPLAKTVDGPASLAALIANDEGARDCMARKWLSFAMGREVTSFDDAGLAPIDAAFAAAGYRLDDLVVAVLTSRLFLDSGAGVRGP